MQWIKYGAPAIAKKRQQSLTPRRLGAIVASMNVMSYTLSGVGAASVSDVVLSEPSPVGRITLNIMADSPATVMEELSKFLINCGKWLETSGTAITPSPNPKETAIISSSRRPR